LQAEHAQGQRFRVGTAQVDITPAPGFALTGFIARLGPSIGVHDRLFARALMLDAGGYQALLISCDLLALDGAYVSSVRSAIALETGIPEQNILILCTHTHSGPATIFLHNCGDVDPTYLTNLRQRLVDVAKESLSKLRVASMGVGCGKVDQGVHNRREPGALIDPEVGVIGFQDANERLLAILVNYACHPVCLDHTNRLISADYPGYLARSLQEQTGAVVIFCNGATGDINPVHMGGFPYAEDLGCSLAEETMRVLGAMEFHIPERLQVVVETLALPLDVPPTEEELNQKIAKCRQQLSMPDMVGEEVNARVCQAMLSWAEDILSRSIQGSLPTLVPVEMQAILLGEVVLMGIPGEIFCELGKEIKNSASPRPCLVLGYSNNDIGYIPTRQAYALGGYEIREAYKYYGYPAVLAPEVGDQLRQAAARLLVF
jgi:neutral ceramidase